MSDITQKQWDIARKYALSGRFEQDTGAYLPNRRKVLAQLTPEERKRLNLPLIENSQTHNEE